MENPYIPPTPLPKPKASWQSWLGVALGAVFAVVSVILMPPMGMTIAFALGASSLAIDVTATVVSTAALLSGNEAVDNWAFWLGIASALSTLGVIGYSRLAAKASTKSVSDPWPWASKSEGLDRPLYIPKVDPNAPASLISKVATPGNSGTVAHQLAKKRVRFVGDTMQPQSGDSVGSTAPTASTSSASSTAPTPSTSSTASSTPHPVENLPPRQPKITPISSIGGYIPNGKGGFMESDIKSYIPLSPNHKIKID